MEHQITRHRHEIHHRHLAVRRVVDITPAMRRVVLAGDDLSGFTSLSFDDHVKLFMPGAGGSEERRDYTPRRYDAVSGELTIDFALHEAGPATLWARHAQPGDALHVAGPRGSIVVPQDFDWWLLVGDETALPAIGRMVEALPATVPVTTIVAVDGPAEEQRFETEASHAAVWVHRPATQADDPAPLIHALGALTPPAGDGFVWIAGEARMARGVRSYVAETMNHPVAWMKASGYWRKGTADIHDPIEG